MGSLYRSTNAGQTWQPIDHNQVSIGGLKMLSKLPTGCGVKQELWEDK
jgi:hypothetical protein